MFNLSGSCDMTFVEGKCSCVLLLCPEIVEEDVACVTKASTLLSPTL